MIFGFFFTSPYFDIAVQYNVIFSILKCRRLVNSEYRRTCSTCSAFIVLDFWDEFRYVLIVLYPNYAHVVLRSSLFPDLIYKCECMVIENVMKP